MKKSTIALMLFVLMVSPGCSHLIESGKTLIGTSTRVLENARVEALSTMFKCSYYDCFDVVLSIARTASSIQPVGIDGEEQTVDIEKDVADKNTKPFEVFMKNRSNGYIVVMGTSGNVNTTEVGIFFSKRGRQVIKVEISSLSSAAKRKGAKAVFAKLSSKFLEKE